MIKLEKGSQKMVVRTEMQASAFLNSGWVRAEVAETPENAKASEGKQGDGAKKYTRTEIARMKTDDLRALATELGLAVTEESTGADLKDTLIEHFGL